jgi:ubiquinone/menaquinone biosynthesis C-methylase UbiE
MAMNNEQLKTTLDFWNPKDMTHARELIHPAEDWSKPTNAIMPLLLDGVKTGGAALEIGCGVGRLLKPMSRHFKNVIGLDIAPNMLALAKQYIGKAGNIQLSLIENDVFPVADSSVDYVFSVIVFQHIYYRKVIQRYLRETRRVLKPGGLVRVQTNKGKPGTSEYHGHFYKSLKDFAAEFMNVGLKVIDARQKLWENSYLWVTAAKSS